MIVSVASRRKKPEIYVPLTKLQCSPTSDGSGAAVLASEAYVEKHGLEEQAGGDGRDDARTSFTAERVGVAVLSLGIINECQRLCVDYARTRELWGKPIGDLQLIQLKLANMEVARVNV